MTDIARAIMPVPDEELVLEEVVELLVFEVVEAVLALDDALVFELDVEVEVELELLLDVLALDALVVLGDVVVLVVALGVLLELVPDVVEVEDLVLPALLELLWLVLDCCWAELELLVVCEVCCASELEEPPASEEVEPESVAVDVDWVVCCSVSSLACSVSSLAVEVESSV